MDEKEYQGHFSEIYPEAAYSFDVRERKAHTMLAVLKNFLKEDLKRLRLLDLGSSTGAIAYYLANHFGQVIGADIDGGAVNFATENFHKANLKFALIDGMNLAIRDSVFDVVIWAHIYEHVPDAKRVLGEIRRVLRPGGICYFAADNRLQVWEPHHRLPFLSWLPRPMSHLYLRLAGRGNAYQEKLVTYESLRVLVREFLVVDYTPKIVRSPTLFCADYMLAEGSLKHKLANWAIKYAYGLFPGYIWLLQKTEKGSGARG